MGGRGETVMDDVPKGRPLAIDVTAQSASPTEPAFITRPDGAPVYHGFVVLDDVTVDRFTLGKITDFEAEPCDEGDAFVIAPEGGRAGLVWEVYDPPYFREIMPVESDCATTATPAPTCPRSLPRSGRRPPWRFCLFSRN